jgi:hypothetical protein
MQIYTKMERMANSDSRCGLSSQTYIHILYQATLQYTIFIFLRNESRTKKEMLLLKSQLEACYYNLN